MVHTYNANGHQGFCGGTEGLEFEIDLNQGEENCGTEKFEVHDKNNTSTLPVFFDYDPVYSWQGKNLSTCANRQMDPEKTLFDANKSIEVTVKTTTEYE